MTLSDSNKVEEEFATLLISHSIFEAQIENYIRDMRLGTEI